jgi:hypothetical protein
LRIFSDFDRVKLMTGFELFLAISIIVVVILLLNVLDSLRKSRVAIQELHTALESFRVRQGDMKRQRANGKNPTVDARVVRTRRGDSDLPRTGRVSTGIKRVRTNGSQPTDD